MTEEKPQLTPALAALDERRRQFVEHYVATGASNATLSAQAAGFSPTNARAAGVTAHRLLKDDRIQAAISETCKGFFAGDLPKFAAALRDIALDPSHRDCVRVLIWLHTTLGISPITKAEIKQQIEVTTNFDREKALAELQRMEREMGVKLLPQLASPEPELDEDEDAECHILVSQRRHLDRADASPQQPKHILEDDEPENTGSHVLYRPRRKSA